MSQRIEIPDAAWDAVVKACPIKDVNAAKGSAWDINELQEKAVRAAAPLIVAAELDSMADYLDECASLPLAKGEQDWVRTCAQSLRSRAIKVRGER
jgi:hypothetical protein